MACNIDDNAFGHRWMLGHSLDIACSLDVGYNLDAERIWTDIARTWFGNS